MQHLSTHVRHWSLCALRSWDETATFQSLRGDNSTCELASCAFQVDAIPTWCSVKLYNSDCWTLEKKDGNLLNIVNFRCSFRIIKRAHFYWVVFRKLIKHHFNECEFSTCNIFFKVPTLFSNMRCLCALSFEIFLMNLRHVISFNI